MPYGRQYALMTHVICHDGKIHGVFALTRKSRILFELIFGAAVLIFLIIYGGAFILATAV